MRESVLASRRSPVIFPLLIVLASGLLGMLLARYFLHTPSLATVVAQTKAPEIAPAVPEDSAEASAGSGPGRTAVAAAPEPSTSTETAAAPAAPQTAAAPESPGYQTEDQEIQLVLRRWQEALLSNNAAQIAPSYAQQVDRYFLQTGVNRAFVRAYLQGQESRGWRLTGFTLHNVTIQHVSAAEVDVRFVAGFAAKTGIGGRAGSARTLLKLRPEDGDWKIFYERDFNS